MNLGGIIKGGLLAGLVINIGESVLNGLVVAEGWQTVMADMGLEQGGAEIAYYLLGGFVLGIIGVWLYAAVRPRLGAGPGTAIKVGLVVWALAWAWPLIPYLMNGLFPADLVTIGLMWGLVEIPLAVLAGAWLYKEDTPA